MRMNANLAYVSIFLVLVFSSAIANAQIGVVAGQPVFNISIGDSQTLNVILVNSGDDPIGFSAAPVSLTAIPNATTPTVTVYPMNGTILGHGSFKVSVTVYIPYDKNKPGLSWTGLLQFLQASNATNPGGAVLQIGVLKVLTVNAAEAIFPMTLFIISIVIVVIVIIAIIIILLYLRRRKKKKEATAKRKGRRKKVKIVAKRKRRLQPFAAFRRPARRTPKRRRR